MAESGAAPADVIGIGLDFTACTILPTTAGGDPPSHTLDPYRDRPHAWAKLWKHHAAQPHADRVNRLASDRHEDLAGPLRAAKSPRSGSSPKPCKSWKKPRTFTPPPARLSKGRTGWCGSLTGALARNACAAGYKGTWHKSDGYLPPEFLAGLNPGLANLYTDKVSGPVVAPGQSRGQPVGGLGGAPGPGRRHARGRPHHRCPRRGSRRRRDRGRGDVHDYGHLHLSHADGRKRDAGRRDLPGWWKTGLCPACFGYEAGQVGVGRHLRLVCRPGRAAGLSPGSSGPQPVPARHLAEKSAAQRPRSKRPVGPGLVERQSLHPGDAELSGLLIGATLVDQSGGNLPGRWSKRPPLGRAMIIETFAEQGVPVTSIVAGGGLTKNNLPDANLCRHHRP